MGITRCPHCGRETFVVKEIGRPFPRPLRKMQVRERCKYCNAVLSVRGGAFTPLGQVLPLAAIALCLVIALSLWPHDPALHWLNWMMRAFVILRIAMFFSKPS